MIEVIDPAINEYTPTPMNRIKMQYNFSIKALPLMSPYPTVEMVVKVKYKAVR